MNSKEKKPSTVFVVSTIFDLEKYRSEISNAISEVGMRPILFEKGNITIKRGEKIPDLISQEIKNSDIVLIVIGHRYGSIFPDTGKSWTEMEYELAKKQKKPILLYFASSDYTWPLSDTDIDRTKNIEFRKKLSKDLAYGIFSNPFELSALIASDLTRILTKGQISKEKSKNVINGIRIIRLFLSSPGDVNEERNHVAHAVYRFNQEYVKDKGLFIKLIRWEDMAPQIGSSTQESVNNQIGDYDLFVGIMWNRFGTPTKISGSGTEEEFDQAIESWKKSKKPWITFYFCDRAINFIKPEQLEQKKKVLEFKEKLKTLGVIRDFNTAIELENLVYTDLLRIISIPDFNKMIQ